MRTTVDRVDRYQLGLFESLKNGLAPRFEGVGEEDLVVTELRSQGLFRPHLVKEVGA